MGFLHNRKPNMRNLSGYVGNVIFPPPSIRRPTVAVQSLAIAPESSKAITPSKSLPAKECADQKPTAKDTTLQEDESSHWVYGTVYGPLLDEHGTTCATPGERVVLVYPMKSDSASGVVRMRLKSVHSRTAQLSLTWVTVYDPERDDPYVVRDYTL